MKVDQNCSIMQFMNNIIIFVNLLAIVYNRKST